MELWANDLNMAATAMYILCNFYVDFVCILIFYSMSPTYSSTTIVCRMFSAWYSLEGLLLPLLTTANWHRSSSRGRSEWVGISDMLKVLYTIAKCRTVFDVKLEYRCHRKG